jgi:hypothetical protein
MTNGSRCALSSLEGELRVPDKSWGADCFLHDEHVLCDSLLSASSSIEARSERATASSVKPEREADFRRARAINDHSRLLFGRFRPKRGSSCIAGCLQVEAVRRAVTPV